jgi:hypothetical protein
MPARKINPYRRPRSLHIHRQEAKDVADAKAGELSFSLRGKTLNTPDAWDDKPITNVRRLYELDPRPWHDSKFDSNDKIIRLRQRRLARKLAA